MSKRGHQQRGKRGMLDKLPAPVRAELTRRCRGLSPFREIREWLANTHALRVSIQTLSHWWMREEETARDAFTASREDGAIIERHGAFEIVVTAPGAREVSVKVYPISPTHPIQPKT